MAEPRRYRRNDAASETEIDGEIFLVEPDSEEIYHLDSTGSALWRLLAEPQEFEEILAVFSDAFPEVAADQLEHDLRRALTALTGRELVRFTDEE